MKKRILFLMSFMVCLSLVACSPRKIIEKVQEQPSGAVGGWDAEEEVQPEQKPQQVDPEQEYETYFDLYYAPENTLYRTDITYEGLARYPDDYLYEYVQFTGTVIQVDDSSEDEIQIRVALDYYCDEVIIAGFPHDKFNFRILENDYITFKGISIGIYTYETVAGNMLSVPAVWIYDISLNN